MFKTLVTAELYAHFLFINIPVSQFGSSHRRLGWKVTQIQWRRLREENWGFVAWSQGVRIKKSLGNSGGNGVHEYLFLFREPVQAKGHRSPPLHADL